MLGDMRGKMLWECGIIYKAGDEVKLDLRANGEGMGQRSLGSLWLVVTACAHCPLIVMTTELVS